jgi:hypothetical protein
LFVQCRSTVFPKLGKDAAGGATHRIAATAIHLQRQRADSLVKVRSMRAELERAACTSDRVALLTSVATR